MARREDRSVLWLRERESYSQNVDQCELERRIAYLRVRGWLASASRRGGTTGKEVMRYLFKRMSAEVDCHCRMVERFSLLDSSQSNFGVPLRHEDDCGRNDKGSEEEHLQPEDV